MLLVIFLSFFLFVAFGTIIPRGKHKDPKYDESGKVLNIGNELELIRPNNIHFSASGSTCEILDINPRTISNDDIVTVSFKSDSPTSDDWLGIYAPLPLNPNDLTSTVPVKFAYCDDDNSYLSTGR